MKKLKKIWKPESYTHQPIHQKYDTKINPFPVQILC